MLLSVSDSSISELYVVDDDRSFPDALFVGQRIYRRDIVTGDSAVLFADTAVVKLADAYARAHPNEAPIAPDEEVAENPSVVAATEADLLSVHGPFVNVEFHVDEDTNGVSIRHSTHRRVLDLRTGRVVPLAMLAADTLAVIAAGRAQLSEFSDSVDAATDERAEAARAAMAGMIFDPQSFSLVAVDGLPAISFLVPGVGDVAGGYAVPLDPVPVARAKWWEGASAALPHERTSTRRTWRGPYTVIAEPDRKGEVDGDGTGARVIVRRVSRRWDAGRFGGEIEQVYRLESRADLQGVERALGRAFDEAGYYSGEVRTAAYRQHPPCRHSRAKQCDPGPPVNQKRLSRTS